MEENGKQREEEPEFPGIVEKHAPGSFYFYPCPHCDEGKADFASFEARDQHIKDYHKIERSI